MTIQQLEVDARLAPPEPLQEAGGAQLDEVAKAGVARREQGDVVALNPRPRGHGRAPIVDEVRLEAEDRLDAGLAARLVVLDRAVHHPMVGEPKGRHLELRRPSRKVADLARSVEQRVLAVDVKVDCRRGHRG